MRYLWLFLVLCGCNKNDFPEYAQLGDLRILTIQATSDQAEVSPGTSVTLQPVISDVNGGGRTVNVTVQSCIDPGLAQGASPTCANPDTNTTSSFSTTSIGSGNTYTGEAPTFSVTVPASNLILDFLPPYLRYNGVSYLVIYTLSAGGGSVTAFKRITVSDPAKTTKNRNPAISGVSANGTAWSNSNTYSGAVTDITPQFSVQGETYQVMQKDGSMTSLTETVTNTWFYSDGSMKYQRTVGTDPNEWTPGRSTSHPPVVVLISHDGRGGEDYKIFVFN